MRVRYLPLVFLIILFSANLSQVGAQTAKTRPATTFSQKMTQSESEMKWSKRYYKSYNRTMEIAYLRLSANHCAKAVQILKEAQSVLPNTTTYYYKVKNSRFDACRFYDELLSSSKKLSSEYHLTDITNLCQ